MPLMCNAVNKAVFALSALSAVNLERVNNPHVTRCLDDAKHVITKAPSHLWEIGRWPCEQDDAVEVEKKDEFDDAIVYKFLDCTVIKKLIMSGSLRDTSSMRRELRTIGIGNATKGLRSRMASERRDRKVPAVAAWQCRDRAPPTLGHPSSRYRWSHRSSHGAS